MTITYAGQDSAQAKTKSETIVVGAEVRIGQFAIPGAGEYDISTIQCEAHALSQAIAYFFRVEDLTLTYLSQIDNGITELDDASNSDILVVDVRSNDTADQLKPILKKVEPAYLLLLGSFDSAFVTALGLPALDSSILKVTRGSLPLEGTSYLPRS